jgi:hypothetical protein
MIKVGNQSNKQVFLIQLFIILIRFLKRKTRIWKTKISRIRNKMETKSESKERNEEKKQLLIIS